MAAWVDLPPEIVENILAHLPHNTPLSPLSLVSRSWLTSVSKFLNPRFSRIHLHYGNTTTFLQLLQSPFCSFLPHVRRLYLHWSLYKMPPSAQEILVAILSDPRTSAGVPLIRPNSQKSILLRVKEHIKKTPTTKECHILNIICLFPRLEHLQVELGIIKSNIPIFGPQRSVSSTLKSLSVICNGHIRTGFGSQEGPFLQWIRTSKMCTIECLYLKDLAPLDHEGAETLVRLQGTSLQHLHIRPRHSADIRPLKSLKLGSSELASLHFEINSHLVSQTVANSLSAIPPQNIVLVGLDIWPGVIDDVVGREHLERLATTLQTRGFVKLRRVHVRLELRFGGFSFESTVQKLREVFPEKLLSVESLCDERRHSVRSLTDDSYQSLS